MTDTEMRLYKSWHNRALKAEKALDFYARHIHWMGLTEDSDVSTVLVAQGDVDSMNGWAVAEAALADTKP